MSQFKSLAPFILLGVSCTLRFAHAAPDPTASSTLSIEEYLRQVERSDPGYRGAIESSQGARAASGKAALLFRPQFFTDLQFIDDTRDTQAPAIQGTSTIKRNASVGIREQTPYGLGVSLSFDANQSSLFNTDPAFVAHPNLTDTYVTPQFKFSLWQNFLGRADRANRQLTEAQDLAAAYGKAYQARATLVDAEARYWKLAVTRELVRVEKASAERARAILDFDQGRVKRHLVDPSDLLLAQAAVKGKELELRGMTDEEHSAARAFNSARGVDSEEVREQLTLPDPEALKALKPGERAGHRGDVKAAEQTAVAESAGSRMAREKLLPELSVFGSIYAMGLNFSFPLDVGTTSSVRDGYAEQEAAADLTYQRKLLDEETEWKDLSRKFEEAKERLAIALELEQVQKAKFEDARARRKRGLTIEFQVFQYELDYLNAALARVQVEGMILGLRAQMNLYSPEMAAHP